MFGKVLTVTLTILLFNLCAVAPARAAQDASAAEGIKARVGRLGAGVPVNVKLTDGSKLKGRIGEADDEGFMLVDAKGGRTRVAYAQVESVRQFKKSGWKTFSAKDAAMTAALFGGIFLVALWSVSQTK